MKNKDDEHKVNFAPLEVSTYEDFLKFKEACEHFMKITIDVPLDVRYKETDESKKREMHFHGHETMAEFTGFEGGDAVTPEQEQIFKSVALINSAGMEFFHSIQKKLVNADTIINWLHMFLMQMTNGNRQMITHILLGYMQRHMGGVLMPMSMDDANAVVENRTKKELEKSGAKVVNWPKNSSKFQA